MQLRRGATLRGEEGGISNDGLWPCGRLRISALIRQSDSYVMDGQGGRRLLRGGAGLVLGWYCFGAGLAGCSGAPPQEAVESATFPLTQQFTPTDDTFINSGEPNNNNGAGTAIFTGETIGLADEQGIIGLMRGLIRFPMPTGLQGRVSVSDVKVTLTVHVTEDGSVGPNVTESLYRVLQPWAQGNGVDDMTTFGLATVGQTCPPAAPGATWTDALCSPYLTQWTNGGGLPVLSRSAAADTTGVAADAPLIWEGVGLNDDVQSWIDSGTGNYGWLIVNGDLLEEVTTSQRAFYATESGSHTPTLSITYACKAGFSASGNGCSSCTAAANAACVTVQGNACVDVGVGATPAYTCGCTNPAYHAGSGAQSCVSVSGNGGASGSGGASAGSGGASAGSGGATAGSGGATAGSGGATAGSGGATAGRRWARTAGSGGASAGSGGASAGSGGASAGSGGASAGSGGASAGSGGASAGSGGATAGSGGASAGSGGASADSGGGEPTSAGAGATDGASVGGNGAEPPPGHRRRHCWLSIGNGASGGDSATHRRVRTAADAAAVSARATRGTRYRLSRWSHL